MGVLSIDLAYKRFRDIGAAVLDPGPHGIHAFFLRFPGEGAPTPETVADGILQLAQEAGSGFVLIDGPQGWKSPDTPFPHSRLCERRLNTPAKTGLPKVVKPRNYGPFVEFSIGVFDVLEGRGWPRFDGNLADLRHRTLESFPLSAWRSLGMPALPSKRRSRPEVLSRWAGMLVERFGLRLESPPGHDELQALVSGLAGLELLKGSTALVSMEGVAPSVLDGLVREGFIVNPCQGPGHGGSPL